ncbi:MAG: tetratricopeptide repeat protein, partial [Planctomycetota bacterium]|nr:tetratricopeptide repeat protein [Planctomycetota bacterium]
DPDYSEALALRRTVGDTIGWMALAARDYLMSYLAFSQLVRFGVPKEKVEHRILQIERNRRVELEWKESRLEEILKDVQQGLHRSGRDSSAPLLDEYVREVLRYRDPQTVRILGKHLSDLATRSSMNSHESGWNQSDDDAVYFICRVLGWIGLPGAVDALGDWAQKSRLREGLVEGAIALCNTRHVEAVSFIEILRIKLGQNSPEWIRVERYLDRLPEAVKDSEATEASILCSRGLRRANKGDFQGALSDFDTAIQLAPEHAQLFVNRGRVYFFLKKHEESLRDFDEAIRLQPWIFEAFMNRGNTYMELGKFEKALSDFNRVLELRPGNAGAYLNRGNAMSALNRLRPAVFEYQRALRMNPGFTSALGNLGVVYLQLNENAKALDAFERLIRIDGRDSRAFFYRGQAKERLKQPRSAMADYQEAIRIQPNDLNSAWALARLYFSDGKYADAIQYCSRVVKLNSSHLYAFQLRARAFDALERYEEAYQDYGEVIRLLPQSDLLTSLGVYNSRGLAALELKRFEIALRDFNHVLKSSPANLVAQIGRGLVFHFQGRHEKAVAVFSAVLEKHGNQPEALQYRGASLVVLKRFREAVRDLNRAAQISPGDPDVFYYRGMAHLGLENRVQAQKDFRKSLQIDPESRWKSQIETHLQDDSK